MATESRFLLSIRCLPANLTPKWQCSNRSWRFTRKGTNMAGKRLLAMLAVVGASMAPVLFWASSPASAAPAQKTTLVVSQPGNHKCGPSQFTTIGTALTAAPPQATVIVCGGTYNEDAVITQPLTLVGLPGAVINPTTPVLQTNSPLFAQAGNNGITIAAPGVTVVGFKVEDATGDGVLSFADHSSIVDVTSNNNSGTGIDLNGSSFSLVKGSVADDNLAGGIQLTNDTGAINPGATASNDIVLSNIANGNVKGCGVILADHLGSTVPGAKGISGNTIKFNSLDNNGTVNGPFGPGAGVVLASEAPGGAVYNNIVYGNKIEGSGLAGVTIHSHVAGQNFAGNVVLANNIGINNLLGDFADPDTTGVYVGSVGPVKVVVADNRIHNNQIGIFAAGKVSIIRSGNVFLEVMTRLQRTPIYAG